jgi:lambda family phage tail tape measure protein
VARQIEDIFLRLKNEGFENLDKIKSSFRELGKVTGFTEVEIARLRKEVLNFDKGIDKSTQTLRGQTDALKALQSQAAVNSTIYRQLGNDLKNLGNAYKEAATGVKQFSDAQLRTQKPGAKVSTFGPQIQTLKRDLAELSVYSTAYAELLTTIKRRELPFNLATGRQNVIAAAEAYRLGPELANAATEMPEMPRTNAALAQSIQEVTDRFANLVRGTRDWREAANELKRLSRESADGFQFMSAGAIEAKTRLDALRTSLKQVGGGFAEFSRNPLQLTQTAADQAATQKSIERNRRKRGLLGAQVSDVPFGPAEPTELFRNIAGIQSQQVTNQLLGRSYTDVAASIRQVSASSDGSLNSLRAQRTAWESLRNALGDNKVALREVDKELAQLDRTIGKRSLGRGRLSGMQLAQGVGAALSGGIFGGPEGLIGGLGGLAVGGVGGAFAGAAFGAQVGMFRQQLSQVTDYSARIDKLQIALRGIVGSQAAYSQALAAAASVTRDLNIPQETAIQGMTRLSAAVQGAGGTVSDSAFAFRAVSEAVKATGGNAEQADGALLALTQVFSKGKVSAEELNQIAERLPGTFTLFAKAAGKSGPELQKALQQGEVGLNDLMKFLQLISSEYGQTALKIAASSQEAGARLTVAMKNMQLEVGRALQPIGASLQSAFADFITKITPTVVTALKGIAAAFEFLIKNKTASGLATFALQLGAVTAGLIALRSAMTTLAAVNIAALFTSTAASAKITGDVMAATALSAGGLTTKIAGLAAVAAKPIVITIVIAGVLEALKRLGEVRSAFDDFKKATGQRSGTAWLKDMGGSALSESQLNKLAADTSAAYNFNVSEIRKLQQQKKNIEMQLNTVDDNVTAAGLRQQLAGIDTRITTAQTRVKSTKANLDAIYKALQQPGVSAASTLTNFPTAPSDTKDKDKQARDKAAKDAQAAAAEQQRLANTLLDQQLRAADRVFQHQIELDRQRYELQKRLDDMQAQNRILRETGYARDIVSNFEELQRSLRDIEERRLTAAQNVRLAKQTQQSAAVRATFAEQGAAALSSGAGISATAIAKATAEAARFTGIANQCSESVKAFYKSLGISLPGVTAWADTVRNAGTVMRDWSKLRPGDIVATGRPGDTPHVGVYTGGNNVFHQSRKRGLTAGNYPDLDYFKSGYFVRPTQSAGSARLPTGAAAQQNRAIQAGGGAVIEGLDVTQAQAQQKLIEDSAAKERAALFEQFTLKATASLREQNATMRDSNELQTLRNRLTLEGVSPERIDLEERLLGIRQEQNKTQSAYTQLIRENPTREAELTAALTGQNEQFAERARLLREGADAAETFNKAMRTRQDERIGLGLREGAEQYVQSIGTMRDATSQLAQTGIKGVEDAIFSLVTTGTANFREFAASILRDTARMIIQQLILRSVMQVIGAIGGGASSAANPLASFNAASAQYMPNALGNAYAANGIVPYAMGGTFQDGITPYAMGGIVDRPTLFKFADGGVPATGLMGEAGPEAIMPLRRLPSGRLGVESAGGGTTNVVVNVDAQGTSIQGDAGQSEALGRVISQAVQAELINQRRRGGILNP